MLPTEEFSENHGPPWKPLCWSMSPEQLQAQAQADLFETRSAVEHSTLQTPGDAMSGTAPGEANEWEQKVDPSNPPEGKGSRAQQWQNTLQNLRGTEPLAGTVHSTNYSPASGTANPPA